MHARTHARTHTHTQPVKAVLDFVWNYQPTNTLLCIDKQEKAAALTYNDTRKVD